MASKLIDSIAWQKAEKLQMLNRSKKFFSSVETPSHTWQSSIFSKFSCL